jgi:peptide/nickel transport system substrate-binding protein
VLSPGTFGYADVSAGFAFDPDQANQLLDDAGWTELDSDGYRTKDGERLTVQTYLDVFDISAKALFQHIQHQWKEIGVELAIGELDYSTYWDTAFSNPETGVLRVGWPHPDPVSLNGNYSSTASNLLKVDDPELDALLAAHLTAVTDDDRQAKLAELQEYIAAQAYVIPLLDDSQVYVARDAVQGFFLTDGALPTFQSTWLAG